MRFFARTGRPLPQTLIASADSIGTDSISRREFLATACSFGASAATAYAMLGLAAPQARAETHQPGGTARIQMLVKPLGDPRTFDWSEKGNVARGWLETLVTLENDGTFTPMLLESWDIDDGAQEYTLNLRRGVTWNNGDPVTAQDVVRNIEGWCDRTVRGNSMAERFAVLVDPETNRVRTDAVDIVDTHTVRLRLPRPDISLIAGMSDYPAVLTHADSDPANPLDPAIGTGPYLPETFQEGVRADLVRNPDHVWWGTEVYGGPYLDRLEYIDLGTDPASYFEAARAGEIDGTYAVDGDFVEVFETLEDWQRNEILSAATIVARVNQTSEVNGARPYADKKVRQALQMAVDNAIILELGYGDRGIVAENHHIGPMHPEYSELPPMSHDPAGARALMEEAGLGGYEHELVSIDDTWRRDSADAVAAQLRDAGIPVRRTILPAADYNGNWMTYGFSVTNWNHRPLGVQIWALAYRSGSVWNEFGWSNAEFDALLDQALATVDVEARRDIVRQAAAIVQEEAVAIQPYWRSLCNFTRRGLQGAAHHVSNELHPARIRWS